MNGLNAAILYKRGIDPIIRARKSSDQRVQTSSKKANIHVVQPFTSWPQVGV
jgi:hypothetical protein